jgi:hypothetical protein
VLNEIEGIALVPKLRLGDALGRQAPLGKRNVTVELPAFLAKQSFAPKQVPKQELGNQKKSMELAE